MKKRVLSILLIFAMLIGMISMTAMGEGLDLINQSFAGLTFIPGGWTVAGELGKNYNFTTNSITTTAVAGTALVLNNQNDFDARGNDYSVSFSISHHGGTASWLYFATNEYAGSSRAATSGYSISFKPSSNYQKAVITLYKNGTELGNLEDKSTNFAYQQLRSFQVVVTAESITLIGANNTITFEDNSPIYSGKIGAYVLDQTNSSVGRIGFIKVSKFADIKGTNITDNQPVSGEISVYLDYPVDESTIINDNVYIMDEASVKITDYEVSCEDTDYGSEIKLLLTKPLQYKKTYTLVLSKNITSPGGMLFAADKKICFTTESPPFEAEVNVDNIESYKAGDTVTANIVISNSVIASKPYYLIVTAQNEDGIIVASHAENRILPAAGEFSGTNAIFDVNLTLMSKAKYVNCYLWSGEMQPIFPEPESEDGIAKLPQINYSDNDIVLEWEAHEGVTTIIMFNNNQGFDTILEDNTIIAIYEIHNGTLNKTIPMAGVFAGEYSYFSGGSKYKTKSEKGVFYYATKQMKNDVIKEVNDVTGFVQLYNILIESERILGISGTTFEICERLEGQRYNETDGAAEFIKAFNHAKVLYGIEIGNENSLFDSEKNIINVDFYNEDIKAGSNAAEFYNDSMPQDSKMLVCTDIIGKFYENIENLHKAFVEAVVIRGIKGREGTTHIKNLIRDNAEYIGITAEKYLELKNTKVVDEGLKEAVFDTVKELNNIINELVASVDLSIYQHEFSTADINSEEWEILKNGVKDTSILNDSTGITATSSYVVEAISRFGVSGTFEMQSIVSRSFNQCYYIFNYKDSQNYYYVVFAYMSDANQYTVIGKVLNGENIEISDRLLSGTISGRVVVVEEEGYVSVKDTSGEDVIGRVYVGAPFEGGKISVKLNNANGNIKNITLSNYQNVHLKSSANIGVNSDIDFEFEYPVKAETVNKTNITISSNGNKIGTNNYNVFVSEDKRQTKITFNEPLNYKTDYTVTFKQEIKLLNRDSGFLRDKEIIVTTETPDVNVILFKGVIEGNNVFSVNTDKLTEIYTFNVESSQLNGRTVRLAFGTSNNTDKSYKAIFALENPEGGTLWISQPVDINSGTISVDAVCPQGIPDGSKFKYYFLDSIEGMHTIYPYSKQEYINGAEKPKYNIKNNVLSVWGTSPGKIAGKNINLIIKNKETGNIVKASTTYSASDGKYEFIFPLVEGLTELISGDYYLIVGGQEFEIPVVNPDFYYNTSAERNKIVKQINNAVSVEEAAIILEDNAKALATDYVNRYGINVYKQCSKPDKDFAAKLIYNMVQKNKLPEADGGMQAQKEILESYTIALYNSGKSNVLYNNNGDFMTEDIIDFSIIDSKFGITVYDIYTNGLTNEGRAKVRGGLLNNAAGSVEDLHKLFIEKTVLYSIKNYNKSGYGHISEILTKNSNAAGMSISKYITLAESGLSGDIDMAIIDSEFNTMEKLQEIINGLVSDNGSVKGGGGPSTRSSGSSAPGLGTSNLQVENINNKPSVFNDLLGLEWANEAINYLVLKNVIIGDGSGHFYPNNNVKREEFVKMVLLGFDIEIADGSTDFKDISESDWFMPYVVTANKIGVINGKTEDMFGTGIPITREETAAIIARVLKLKGIDIKDEGMIELFEDSDNISMWAKEAMSFLVKKGVINGISETKLAPSENCTRAQVAKMIYSTLQKIMR